jgi:hypothetical protein
MRTVFPLAMIAAAALFQACASTPAREDAVPEPMAAATDAPATPAADAGAKARDPYPNMRKRIGPDGMTLYCREEIPTGERIPKEMCYTEHAMRELTESKREQIEKMRERSTYGTGNN